MAETSLTSALEGLSFAPSDTGWGLAQSVLAKTAPNLINPYGSVGQNLGVGLGAILIQALLGYQAKSEAMDQTLAAADISNRMMKEATTPESRIDFLKGLGSQDVDTDVLRKVSGLATALNAQEKLISLEDEKRKKVAEAEVAANIAKTEGIPLENVPDFLAGRQEAIKAQREALTTGATGAPGTVGAPGGPRDIPIQYKTQDEIKAGIEAGKREQDMIQRRLSNIKESRNSIQQDQAYKDAQDVRANLLSAQDLAKQKTPKADDTLILLAERIGNPGNQVTDPEFRRGSTIQTVADRIAGEARRMFMAEGQLSDPARQQILDVVTSVADRKMERFNSRVNSELDFLKRQGVSDITVSDISPSKLYLTRESANRFNTAISEARKQLEALNGPGVPKTIETLQRKEMLQRAISDLMNTYERY